MNGETLALRSINVLLRVVRGGGAGPVMLLWVGQLRQHGSGVFHGLRATAACHPNIVHVGSKPSRKAQSSWSSEHETMPRPHQRTWPILDGSFPIGQPRCKTQGDRPWSSKWSTTRKTLNFRLHGLPLGREFAGRSGPLAKCRGQGETRTNLTSLFQLASSSDCSLAWVGKATTGFRGSAAVALENLRWFLVPNSPLIGLSLLLPAFHGIISSACRVP